MLSPTNLPSGAQLKALVLKSLLSVVPNDDKHQLLSSNERLATIIPEVAFSDVFLCIGEKLFEPFQILGLGKRNFAHEAIRRLGHEYSAPIFTTNFDLFLEEHPADHDSVIHLHGDLRRLSEIAILLSTVGRSAAPHVAAHFRSTTRSKSIFVVGYSGNDRDVLDLLNSSQIDEVYWLIRSPDDSWARSNIQRIQNRSVYEFFGDLSDFFAQFSDPDEKGNANSKASDIAAEKNNILSRFSERITLSEGLLVLSLLQIRVQEYKRASHLAKEALRLDSLPTLIRAKATAFYAEAVRLSTGDTTEVPGMILDALQSCGTGDELARVELLSQMAVILIGDEKWAEARSYTEQAISLASAQLSVLADNQLRRCVVFLSAAYNNLGLVHYNSGEIRESGIYFIKSLRMKRRIGHVHGEIASAANLALLYCKLEENVNFRRWEAIALNLARSYSAWHRIVDLSIDLASLFFERGLLDEATNQLNRAQLTLDSNATDMDSRRALLQKLSLDLKRARALA